MTRRTGTGAESFRAPTGAFVTLNTETDHAPLDLLPVSSGPTHIVVVTADGPRSFGALSSHRVDALRELDVWLDAKDAANELPDGRLEAA